MMRSTVSLAGALLALACGTGSVGGPASPAPAVGVDTLDLVMFVRGIEQVMPLRDSRRYVLPDEAARVAFRAAVSATAQQQVARADSLVRPYGYTARRIVDRRRRVPLVVLQEQLPITRGWGTFLFDPSGVSAGVDVHANHPISDEETPAVAAGIFSRGGLRWFLMAGAHRYTLPGDSSDMARQPASIFQIIHEAIAPTGRRAISVHGFSRTNHTAPIDTSDIVLSEGTSAPDASAGALALRASLRGIPLRTGLFGVDSNFGMLGAGSNPQGQWSNQTLGRGRWVHIEIAREIRTDSVRTEQLVDRIHLWILTVL